MRTETLTWQSKTGKTVTVTVALERQSRHVGTDEWTGEALSRDEGLAITYEARVEGMGVVGTTLQTARHPSLTNQGIVATIGKLGISGEHFAALQEARARLESSPEWQDQEARRAKLDAEMADYEASRRRIYRAMGR